MDDGGGGEFATVSVKKARKAKAVGGKPSEAMGEAHAQSGER